MLRLLWQDAVPNVQLALRCNNHVPFLDCHCAAQDGALTQLAGDSASSQAKTLVPVAVPDYCVDVKQH